MHPSVVPRLGEGIKCWWKSGISDGAGKYRICTGEMSKSRALNSATAKLQTAANWPFLISWGRFNPFLLCGYETRP